MKKKEYIAPHIQLLHAETMANIAAASEQTVNIVDDLTEEPITARSILRNTMTCGKKIKR